MASTFAVTRNHLIFGVCLPLAVLLGYTLADVTDPASFFVILAALGLLAVPVLMNWYHPLLILSWNSVLQPALPGHPSLWSILAVLGLFIAILNRSVNPNSRILMVPALTRPILVLTGVIVLTAVWTGGIGLQIFGSQSVGGKSYVWVFSAIAGYFALSSRPIPSRRAYLYLAMFFLPGLTSMVTRLAQWSGVGLDFVALFFPIDFLTESVGIDQSADIGAMRISGLVLATEAVIFWILARYGILGVFDFTKPWRFVVLVGAVILSMFGGFRSALILVCLTFFILFCVEKLWRNRIMALIAFMAILGGVLLFGFADKLPFSVQRTLSFLPLNLDPISKQSAEVSTEWRVEMWKMVLPQVPRYLFKGKGYVISADDLFMVQEGEVFGHGTTMEISAVAGDYHNGLLSVVIPFGIYGVGAFSWFLFAGARFLYRMYRDGAPGYRQINAFLFALFLARILLFILVFGSFSSDLFYFMGILGFSVALNVSGQRLSPATDDGPIPEAQ